MILTFDVIAHLLNFGSMNKKQSKFDSNVSNICIHTQTNAFYFRMGVTIQSFTVLKFHNLFFLIIIQKFYHHLFNSILNILTSMWKCQYSEENSIESNIICIKEKKKREIGRERESI